MAEKKMLNWAVLGTGVIANEMAQALQNMGRTLYAVGNRTHEKAVMFARKYNVKKVYNHFEDMFNDPDVDIIYLTTPHNTHISFLRTALKNGKHVLCEKSITLNSAELAEAMDLAREKNVVLAEAMTIYHMPIYKKMRQMVQNGSLGEIRMLQLNFGSYKEYDMTNRFFNKAMAGGALLDIGVYALSLARCFMCSRPTQIVSQVQFAPSGADEASGIVLTNAQGQMAVISLTLHAKQPKRAVVCGDLGYIEVMEYPRANAADIVWTQSGTRESLCLGEREKALQYELEDMEAAVRGEKNEMLLDYTADVMQTMTEIRRQWGMYYDAEQQPAQ